MELQEVQEIAEKFIRIHVPEYDFAFNNRKRSVGMCNYTDKIIYLSCHFVALLPKEQIINTLTHEIAHALTPGDKHGLKWKAAHKRLGGDGKVTCAHDIPAEERGYKWRLVSPTGVVLKHWFRKPAKTTFAKVHNFYEGGKKDETLGKCRIEKI